LESQDKSLSLRSFDIGREALKWTAIITMTIDHIGAVLYPDLIFLRVIGRIAFPIFSYLLVLGAETTRNSRNYMIRLLIFAFISQIPFYLAVGYSPLADLNIFFTLAFGLLFLINPILIMIPFVASFFINFDYGLYGILLIAGMRLLRTNTKLGIPAVILIGLLPLLSWDGSFLSIVQICALLAFPLIMLHNSGCLKIERKISEKSIYPRWTKFIYYAYYPIHLTLFYLIKIGF
jgi:hypothetical protein